MKNNILIPKAFVIEPDYMVDVTSIANAFKPYGTEPAEAVVNKFKPTEMSVPLLVGNSANYLLDEIVNNPEVTFEQLIPKIFQLNPLQFSCLDDKNVIEVLSIIKRHFKHLKHTIRVEFKKEAINPSSSYLEPSFYSRDYGIQGRLDLLHEDSGNKHLDIIELKSGSPFMPNSYGLSIQHYTQTLLYDLIIKSVYRGKKNTSNYILYSKESDWQLRNAPVLKVQQYEALKTRNDLLLIESMLHFDGGNGNDDILSRIRPSAFPKAKGFTKKNVQAFHEWYSQLDRSEKEYIRVFTKFISRQHRLAKVGEHGLSKANGLAALWLEEKEEKEERFSILHSLVLKENNSSGETPTVTLLKTSKSPELSRFRKGDIVVLYPQNGIRSVLQNQIFKCNIIHISLNEIVLKLRSRQYNQDIFNTNKEWSIEGDVMDSSFLSMYRSMYTWGRSHSSKRDLLMGKRPPSQVTMSYKYHSEEMTNEQNLLLNRIISSQEYYLLWGPPGTGKTSVMIKHLVHYLYKHTQETIVLVAYTNRAVDEICDAILEALKDIENPFIRIGSSNACHPSYIPYLLDQQVSKMRSRKEILGFLKSKRILVSTVSSIINRVEIFHLFDFDTIIIDEASQILEPMIIGLLTYFKRFVMIGDHKQLPAVAIQDPADTEIKAEILNDLDFMNTNMSLFERLYNRCKNLKWEHALGVLFQQGRMHNDLMEYPNTYFYENKLRTIPGLSLLSQDIQLSIPEGVNHEKWSRRLVYIPTPIDEELSWKTNQTEAEVVSGLIQEILKIYDHNKLSISANTVGVITPYRAQIALIRSVLQESISSTNVDLITVDTVERYQGSARDIIIISFCTNRMDQMERLVSLSSGGIDRKLNVALTRARQRIIFLGNKEVLTQDVNYRRLINMSKVYTKSSVS